LKKFEELGLSKPLLDGLVDMGFESPTEIQQQAIPILLKHDGDFIGLAQTGTGKTAAFGLPLLELMDTTSRDTQALILAPTRELAQQICHQLELMSAKLGKLNVVPVFGGANIMTQIREIRRGAQVIVATPGRLMDLMKRKEVKLDSIKFMVLDEADEMLNMGFKEDIDYILSKTDSGRHIWLFSATMAREIKRIVDTYMVNPEEVKINRENIVNTNIEHQVVQLKASDKIEALRRYLDYDEDLFGVVFCRTKRDTQRVADELNNNGYATEALHGDMSQAQRDAAMKRFRDKNLKLLIATDVAARGIDVDDITHVIHFALPDDPEFYTHRSGRTARAGKKGVSIALITRGDNRKLKHIAHKLGIEFEKAEIPALEAITKKRMARWSDNLINQKVSDKISEDLIETVLERFDDLSKEEIIKRLLTKEYNSIHKRNSISDLNDRSKPKNDREPRERGNRSRGKEEGMKTYFINLGRKDDMNKGALLGFVCDATGISGNDVGRIVLDGAHSFMDVREEVAGKLDKLNGMNRNGHDIRANEHHGKVTESRDRGGRSFRNDRGDRNSGFKGRGRRSDDTRSSSRDESPRAGSFKNRSKEKYSEGKREGKSKPDSKQPRGRSKFFGTKWD
jgi:ATP-dependent RNA helicase DeaD